MSRGNFSNFVSVVVPTYNEADKISQCIESLVRQTYQARIEIIIVDDGSFDKTQEQIKKTIHTRGIKQNIIFLSQQHKGPGEARNLGARKAKGEILVFIDADMSFEPTFIDRLTKLIRDGKAIGTDSQSEMLGNPKNYWALCWNLGRFAAAGVKSDRFKTSMVPNPSNYGGIYRAILKREFERVGGFEKGGDYTDDESLARKIGQKALLANDAKFYHFNPDRILDVWQRASWIGSGKKFTSNNIEIFVNLIKFFPPVAIAKGLWIGLQYNYPQFVFFKVLYDTAIWCAVIKSL